MSDKDQPDAVLLGLGLDNDDGHKRITRGERICIAGGSEETHGRMAETAIKTMEDLEDRGKALREIDPRELKEIIHKNTPET